MFVRATEDFETPSHNVVKGALVDLPDDQARQAIDEGKAVEVGTERAISSLSGTETAEDTSAKVAKNANDNAKQQATSEPRRGQAPSWAKR